MKIIYSSYLRRLSLLLLLASLAACSTVEPTDTQTITTPKQFSIRHDELFGKKPDIIDRYAVLKLTTEQEQQFLDFYRSESRVGMTPNQRVAEYIQRFIEGFTYKNETNTAQNTTALAQGNCLSLAILTTSLAELVDVRIGYQLTDSVPVYHLNDEVIFKGLHIRSMLFDPNLIDKQDLVQRQISGIQIDYFPTGTERYRGNVSQQEFTARYYLNLAATAVSQEDYSKAYWLTVEAMDYMPTSSDALNTMGVIYKRVDEYAKAEEIYLYGIAKLPNNLSLLKNYRILLEDQNRKFDAWRISRTIDALDDTNPFDLIYAAQEYYDQGEYKRAIKLYKKALDLAPHINQIRLSLAQSHYQAGQRRAARKQLQQAVTLASSPSTQTLYQAKLNSLNHEFR